MAAGEAGRCAERIGARRKVLLVGLLALVSSAACGEAEDVGVDPSPTSASPTSEPLQTATTSPPEPTTTPSSGPPTVPHVLWDSWADAADTLEDADLSPLVAGLNAGAATPDDDWLVVGVTAADGFSNVGITVASPGQLKDGVRVNLLSDSVVLYASIRKARQDVWAFARVVGNDPVDAASDCAKSIFDAIGDEDLVVLCYVYENRDLFDAEQRNEDGESPGGLICGRAYSSTGPGDNEPFGQDLGSPDASCPAGTPDDIGAGIERVPLPPGAVAHTTERDGTGGPADADARAYTVPGASLADVAAFYDAAMPAGTPWLGWIWCERHQFDDLDERVWTNRDRSGTGLLRVTIGRDPDGSTFVVVARHGTCSST